MRLHVRAGLFLLAVLAILSGTCLVPTETSAKVYFYALTQGGGLVKYDPDADRIVLKVDAGQGYITPRLEDSSTRHQTRVLDVARQRIVTIDAEEGAAQAVLIDLKARTAKQVPVAPGVRVKDIPQLIYPRKASRFYVHWMRTTASPRPESVLTAVGLDGQALGTSPSPLGQLDWPVYHPDGRDFYISRGGRATLYNGETLGVAATYDFAPFVRPELRGPRIFDVRDGRALLAGTPVSDTGETPPWTVFTTDLTFSSQSASPRIATGLSQQVLRLVQGGRTVLLQETLDPPTNSGAGRLHFFDVATGTKLGMVEFPAPEGADLLGLHPDGRRLFVRVFDLDPATAQVQYHLVIVDVVTRTVIRNRVFENIGFATDFVDEP